jgi:hypothetical protein
VCWLHVQEFADGGDLLQLLLQQGTRLSERRATQMVLQPLLRAVSNMGSRNVATTRALREQ